MLPSYSMLASVTVARWIFDFSIVRVMLLCTVPVLLFAACGEDQMDRGIPDHVDAATPIDPDQLAMTEEERRRAEEKEVEQAEQKAFDANPAAGN